MELDGERLLPAGIKIKGDGRIEMTILEGKNRQIRRMFGALGYEVLSLIRIQIGTYQVGGLKPGEWRYLGGKEIEKLGSKRDRSILEKEPNSGIITK